MQPLQNRPTWGRKSSLNYTALLRRAITHAIVKSVATIASFVFLKRDWGYVMSSHEREEELRKRLRLIHLLHQTNSYPTGPGTANQRRQRRRRWRRRWQQLLALADRIYSFPDPPTDTPLDLAIQQLQNLAIESIPDPPTNTPEALCDPTKDSRSPQD
uniref:Protein Rev n=109 Tax=Simian immunodeficiency virus TaxID=11723 RepID=Q88071_SIV|nr:rev1 [Simian immunodeficiency virus]